ncbi:MAG: tRNA lysidine(34) synthetase TilS [Opitutae bacterium]|nr:tRNA lysidine(34) synthetase TilS [Opitutae bacterium]
MTRKEKSPKGWSAVAARVGELLPPARLHPAVLAWAAKRRMPGTWGIAFSGGADSLALLLLLRAHFPGRRLVALHFNHRLRGRAADADAAFCTRVCRALGVKCVVGAWRTAPKTASEGEARSARHEFFGRALKKLRTKALWLAHQQDDIAESMLMRLARGSGAGGLAAPRPVQKFPDGRVYLRPLLTLKKTELVAALNRAGTVWREDTSNAGDDHFRNRIRRRVLPAWAKAAGRDAVAGAARARELLEEDETALEAWLDELKPMDRRGRLDLDKLKGKPRAVLRRALHRWLLVVRPETDLSRQGFSQLLAALERGRDTRFSLGAKGFAVVRRGLLKFRRA